ncbi:MAG: hypothetical protein WBL02_04660 [Methanomethylovorans sp.]|uniref:hypothetical protein n=1 Tax=Methanomethylovorans sp. TaxID=2758717 RepID=UPI003C78712B
MTSEIVIMNKAAIAMAADSAVTFSGHSQEKIFPSAQKLFSLSDQAPVGIMVYGNATFMEIPWETIIKIFRIRQGSNLHNSLEEYANAFIEFLDGNETLFSQEIQINVFKQNLYSYMSYIKSQLAKSIQEVINSNETINEDQLKSILSEIINSQYVEWKEAIIGSGFSKDFDEVIFEKYGELIDDIISQVFEEFPLDSETFNKLKQISPWIFYKFPMNVKNSLYSGIVIAGFGEEEIFPSIKSYIIECMVCNKLKYEIELISKLPSQLFPTQQETRNI